MATNEEVQWTDRFTTLLLMFLTYQVSRVIYNLTFHPLSKVPGPWIWSASRVPFVIALLRGTIVHDIERLHKKYGPVLRIAPDEVTFAQPEAWNDIFQLRPGHQQFLKDTVWWKHPPGMPESLVSTIDPEAHGKIRKMLAPGFTTRALKSQEPILHQYVNLLVERICEIASTSKDQNSPGAELDISPWLNFTTFDIFGDLGFGESFNCLQHSKYHPWVALLFHSVKAASFVAAARFYPLVEFLLMKCIPPTLKKMQDDHYQQIVDKVNRRLNFELQRPDIMSHVISAEGDLPIGVINMTFMILTNAGSETTATTLCGALNYLIQHRDKLNSLEQEVRRRFRTEGEITLDALRNLNYLNAVLNEALRLCPPIPWMLPRRIPKGGDTVCGTWLPENTVVSVQTYTMNRDPNYFHCATSFIPERWLPEASTNPDSAFFRDRREALQPFSTGPRSCMGQHLAWAEMRLILAKLLWTFDFSPVAGKVLNWEDLRTFLLVEKKPIDVRIRLREFSVP